MEKGVKNLQVASRTATRREKAASTATEPTYSESPDVNEDPHGDSGLADVANTSSNNGDDPLSLSANQPQQQHHTPPFQYPQSHLIQAPPLHHTYPSSHAHQDSTSHSGGGAQHQRGMSYTMSSSSAASSSATSPTFTAPSSSRTWSSPSNYPGPPSTLLQTFSPPPPPVQQPPMNRSGAADNGGYGHVPTTTGQGLPTIASLLRERPMRESSAVTSS